MLSLFTFTLLIFSSFLTLISARYVDLVCPSEQDLAAQVDQYALSHHQEVYHFIAKTYDDRIVIQIRFENDTVGFEGYLTETPQLIEDLELVQKKHISCDCSSRLVKKATQTMLYQWTHSKATDTVHPLKGIKKVRGYFVNPVCREWLRDVHGLLEKKASRCGQFCSRGANYITPGCMRCYYTGGACQWQKSCQI